MVTLLVLGELAHMSEDCLATSRSNTALEGEDQGDIILHVSYILHQASLDVTAFRRAP